MGYRIAHVGAFDFENFGDLLFTDVLKAHLEKRITVNEIIYFAPKACKMPNKEVWVHAVTELENFVKDKKIDKHKQTLRNHNECHIVILPQIHGRQLTCALKNPPAHCSRHCNLQRITPLQCLRIVEQKHQSVMTIYQDV